MGKQVLRKGILRVLALSVLALLMMWVGSAIAESPAKGLFPNSKLIWEREFGGKIRDIQVGNENIVVLTDIFDKREGLCSVVYYLGPNGNILWEKRFDLKPDERGEYYGGVDNVSISAEGGEVIINSRAGCEWVITKSYDKDGNLKWETPLFAPGLTLSPKGDYAITTHKSGVERWGGYFRVFDNRTGEELWWDKGKESIERGSKIIRTEFNWVATFLNDSEVVYFKGYNLERPYVKLLLFNVKNLKTKWEIDIGERLGDPLHFRLFFNPTEIPQLEVSESGKFMAIAVDYSNLPGEERSGGERRLVVLSNEGDILWNSKDFVTIEAAMGPERRIEKVGGLNWFCFIDDSKSLLAESGPPSTIDIFDLLTGKRRWRKVLGKDWNSYWHQCCASTINKSFVTTMRRRERVSLKFEEVAVIFSLETGEICKKSYDTVRILPMMSYENGMRSFIILDRGRKVVQKVKASL